MKEAKGQSEEGWLIIERRKKKEENYHTLTNTGRTEKMSSSVSVTQNSNISVCLSPEA